MDDGETEIQKLNATDQLCDKLSSLPEDILLRILSLVSTKRAIRTSVLSKRWKYLWISLPNFSFVDLKASFLDSIEKALVHRNAQYCLGEVSLSLHSDVSEARFSEWLSAVAEHKLQFLILDLPEQYKLVLPQTLCTSKSLKRFYMRLPSGLKLPSFVCFSRLKAVKLVDVSFHSTQNLFSGCPVLEELCLRDCYWEGISEITIEIPTLRAFTFEEMSSRLIRDHFSKIILSAMRLKRLKVSSYTTVELVPSNPPCLDGASIDIHGILGGLDLSLSILQLLSAIRNVKFLYLSSKTLERLCFAENIQAALPTFDRLTSLYGCCDDIIPFPTPYTNTAMMYIVEKSPKLRTLHFPRGFKPGNERRMLETVPSCFVSSLRRFRISGFDGDAGDISLLKHVYKNAPRLKQLSINCKPDFSEDLQKQEEIHQHLRQLRGGSARCSIKFIIPSDAPTT